MMYNNLFLGASYTRENTTFSVWSPKADKVELNLYKTGNGDTLIASKHMQKGNDGVWNITLSGDWNKVYYKYTFQYQLLSCHHKVTISQINR